jgi:hypothetical protein
MLPGDRIRVINPHSKHYGKIGYIAAKSTLKMYDWKVDLKGEYWNYSFDEEELEVIDSNVAELNDRS